MLPSGQPCPAGGPSVGHRDSTLAPERSTAVFVSAMCAAGALLQARLRPFSPPPPNRRNSVVPLNRVLSVFQNSEFDRVFTEGMIFPL